MSMGPRDQIEKVGISKFDRINGTVKRTAEKFYNEPIHYLFYTMLSGTIIGLFVGMSFSWQYYAILGALLVAKIGKNISKNEE